MIVQFLLSGALNVKRPICMDQSLRRVDLFKLYLHRFLQIGIDGQMELCDPSRSFLQRVNNFLVSLIGKSGTFLEIALICFHLLPLPILADVFIKHLE